MRLGAVCHGRARQSSGTGSCWDCRRVLWVPGPRGQYSGKIRFTEKLGVQDEGGRHVAKRSSDPRVAYTGVKLQVRDLVKLWVLLTPLPTWGWYPGKIRFVTPQEVNVHRIRIVNRRPVPGVPSSGTPRDSLTNFRAETVWGL